MKNPIYLRQLYSLSKKDFVNHLYDMIDTLNTENDIISNISGQNQHAFYEHTGLSEEEMYRKVRNGSKRTEACFFDKNDLIFFLKQTLEYNVERITDWFLDDKESRLVLNIDHAPDIVGSGFYYEKKNKMVKEYNTTASTVVLSRSKNPFSEFGFNLETIYPNIENVDTINRKKNPSRIEITNPAKMRYLEEIYKNGNKSIQSSQFYSLEEIEEAGLNDSYMPNDCINISKDVFINEESSENSKNKKGKNNQNINIENAR